MKDVFVIHEPFDQACADGPEHAFISLDWSTVAAANIVLFCERCGMTIEIKE